MEDTVIVGKDDREAAADPKAAAGSRKPSFQHLSPAFMLGMTKAMEYGAARYGAYNWAENPMKASVYYDAIMRHLMLWWTGSEEISSDAGAHHMAHIACCAMIIHEQSLKGTLVDDRPRVLDKTFDLQYSIIETEAQLTEGD